MREDVNYVSSSSERRAGYFFERPATYQPVYVVDASVVIKWFSEEEDSGYALRLLEDCLEGRRRLLAPSLLVYEVANALRFNEKLHEEDLRGALRALGAVPISTASFRFEALAGVCRLARERRLTVYDAAYLALAMSEGVPLVTADRLLLQQGSPAALVLSPPQLYGA